ncbi:hypothetical protein KSF78_0005087 [Schistosoma japonicum]|nr:hypothetical protein KSF78_0005087 [Schistosoma japonicum]KAH8876933.1 hypothetical protein KSF78_0005087 [Schistosoma japonicum]
MKRANEVVKQHSASHSKYRPKKDAKNKMNGLYSQYSCERLYSLNNMISSNSPNKKNYVVIEKYYPGVIWERIRLRFK